MRAAEKNNKVAMIGRGAGPKGWRCAFEGTAEENGRRRGGVLAMGIADLVVERLKRPTRESWYNAGQERPPRRRHPVEHTGSHELVSTDLRSGRVAGRVQKEEQT